MAIRENESTVKSKSNREVLNQLQARTDLSKAEAKILEKYRRDLENEGVKSKYALMRELEEEAHKARMKKYEEEGNKIGSF